MNYGLGQFYQQANNTILKTIIKSFHFFTIYHESLKVEIQTLQVLQNFVAVIGKLISCVHRTDYNSLDSFLRLLQFATRR